MRRIFQDLSPLGGGLIFISLVFGIFLRFYGPDINGPWSDELATLYFAQRPGLIFIHEAHPPLFYYAMALFWPLFGNDYVAYRLLTGVMSLGLSLWAVWLARKVFDQKALVLFCIMIFLAPTDVVYARSARMYSLLFELTLLVLLLYRLRPRHTKALLICSFLASSIHPLGFIPGLALALTTVIRERKFNKESLFYLLSLAPAGLYHLARLIFIKKGGFVGNFLGGHVKEPAFISDLIRMFAGEYFPKVHYGHLPAWVLFLTAGLLILILLGSLLGNSRARLWDCFMVVLVTALFTYVFSKLVVNIKVARYFVFLVPVFVIMAVEAFSRFDIYHHTLGVSVFLGIIFYHGFVLRPFDHYPWEREAWSQFMELKRQNPDKETVLCATKFQYSYYFNESHRHCRKQYEKLRKKGKGFVFMDMNGFMRPIILEFIQGHELTDYQIIGASAMCVVKPKEKL